jgi:hypothetical protein
MKIFMWIIHHFIRPLWSIPIALGGFIYYFFWRLKKQNNVIYKKNKKAWDDIKSLDELVSFFKNIYQYKYDGHIGILDHDNTPFEFYSSYGDCDDMARYITKKLRKLGYKAKRVHMWYDPKTLFKEGVVHWFSRMHYACMMFDGDKKYMVNYYYIKECEDIKSGVKTIDKKYHNGNYCIW